MSVVQCHPEGLRRALLSSMNFSEYMAILSGNTDLLDKAKLEKRIASLESERKAHSKGIADSKFRYQTITHDIANNEAALERMKADRHGMMLLSSVTRTEIL